MEPHLAPWKRQVVQSDDSVTVSVALVSMASPVVARSCFVLCDVSAQRRLLAVEDPLYYSSFELKLTWFAVRCASALMAIRSQSERKRLIKKGKKKKLHRVVTLNEGILEGV